MQTQTHMTAKELASITGMNYHKISRILYEARCPTRLSQGPNRYEISKAKFIIERYFAASKYPTPKTEQSHAN
jgi:hypothetical protein